MTGVITAKQRWRAGSSAATDESTGQERGTMVFTFVTFELHVLFHFTLVRCSRPRSTRCRRTSSTKRRAELSKTYMLVISNGKMVLMLVYVAVCSMLVAYEIALGVGRRAVWVGSDTPVLHFFPFITNLDA